MLIVDFVAFDSC